jgi:nitroreductase
MTIKNTFTISLIISLFLPVMSAYPRANTGEDIILPAPNRDSGISLMRALDARRSQRKFKEKELTDDKISDLLWAAVGVNRKVSGKRTAPTARDSREITVFAATEKGLYEYLPTEHRLRFHSGEDIRDRTGVQGFTGDAPLVLIYVADLSKIAGDERTKNFYSAVDTGFISQNVYLYCASEGLATVVLGWVDKPALHKLMDLGSDKKIILTQPVAFPAE